jgi:hypothetical protein
MGLTDHRDHSYRLGGVAVMDWIDHNGKFLPDHARLADQVLVRFRDGEETRAAEPVRHWAGTASNWSWDRRHPSPSEIVAYRVVR